MRTVVVLAIVAAMVSCKLGKKALFSDKEEGVGRSKMAAPPKKASPGAQWIEAAAKSLNQPVPVNLPFSDKGHFAAEQPHAVGYIFTVPQGNKVVVKVMREQSREGMLFTELYLPSAEPMKQTLLATIDTTSNTLEYAAHKGGTFQLRIQPELMRSVDYEISIQTTALSSSTNKLP